MSPRTVVTGFLLAMVLVMVAVATLTVASLTDNRSDIERVSRSVTVSDAYWAALNSAIEANLYAVRLQAENDPDTRKMLMNSLLEAFQATESIKENGTAEDRQLIGELETRFALPMAQALQFLARPDDSPLPQSSTSDQAARIIADVRDALLAPAAQRRQEAIQELDALQAASNTRSIAIIAALGFGFLAIVAVVIGVRHYDRRAVAREAELERLRETALVDSVSGLGNHRAFQEELRREWARTARQGEVLTLVLGDLDDFKRSSLN